MHPGFVFALSWGYSLCSVCSPLGFHRFGSMRFDYERSYVLCHASWSAAETP